ncbi:Ger(x)C family spore germination protein [Guptibacillus hwajinpoensis]|uniref:Ger(x)C family spore germination protein n=1 Tax=Guptibacillus hwajinpoensis TaxID=208199 RepID=UPI0038511AF6
MKPLPLTLTLLICIPLLGGCWDQSALKDKRIINGVSIDVSETDPDILLGSLRAVQIQGKGGGKFEIMDTVLDAEKETIGELEAELQNKVPGKMDFGKAFIIMIGEELAKDKGISPIIEPFYRSSKGYIASRIVIGKGRAHDLLTIEDEQQSPIVFEILRLLEGSENETYSPKENTFTIVNKIVDKERDVMIPMLEPLEPNQIRIYGAALFNGDHYSGFSLAPDQIPITLFLDGKFKKRSKINIRAHDDLAQPFTIEVQKVNRNLEITIDEQKQLIECHINVALSAKVASYYNNGSPINTKQLNELASTELTKRATEITDTFLEANSDVLGIQKAIKAQYPDFWKKKNWDTEFQQINIIPNLTVDITSTYGIK